MQNSFERDEMFRLTSMKLSAWRRHTQAVKMIPTAEMSTKEQKQQKKDKPKSPRQQAKEEKKPAVVIEPDTTPFGHKKDMTKPMLDSYHPK